MLGTIVGALFAGIIIGPLARLVIPGKQDISLIMTIVIGAVGALLGGMAARAMGVAQTNGIDWIQLALEVAAAAVCVVVFLSFSKGKK